MKLKKCQIHEQNHTKLISLKVEFPCINRRTTKEQKKPFGHQIPMHQVVAEPQRSKKNLLDIKSSCIKLSQNHGRKCGGTSKNQMTNPKVATKPRK
jgi:hypothetical protein